MPKKKLHSTIVEPSRNETLFNDTYAVPTIAEEAIGAAAAKVEAVAVVPEAT